MANIFIWPNFQINANRHYHYIIENIKQVLNKNNKCKCKKANKETFKEISIKSKLKLHKINIIKI